MDHVRSGRGEQTPLDVELCVSDEDSTGVLLSATDGWAMVGGGSTRGRDLAGSEARSVLAPRGLG